MFSQINKHIIASQPGRHMYKDNRAMVYGISDTCAFLTLKKMHI